MRIMDEAALTKIVKDALAKSAFATYPLSIHKFSLLPNVRSDKLVHLETADRPGNLFWRIFNAAAPSKQANTGTYYHFKSLALAKVVLNSGELQASNLFSNRYNDFAEAEEFVRRYSNPHPLIPTDYTKGAVVEPRKRGIDDMKQNTCILCFTSSYADPRFWKSYLSGGKGVCFELEYVHPGASPIKAFDAFDTTPRTTDLFYELREVCYDPGNLFDFVNEISSLVYDECKKVLMVPGVTKMASWYKRNFYAWERETRVVFDLQFIEYFAKIASPKLVTGDDGSGRRFVIVPIENAKVPSSAFCPFILTLKRIIYGYDLSSAEKNEIEKLALKNFNGVHFGSMRDLV